MKKNKGFSLIELIVIIAIMAILAGALTPLFVKYVENKKAQACLQNREAIMSIYEKSVYAMDYHVDVDNVDKLLQANDFSERGREYAYQAMNYIACPDDGQTGHYYASVDGSKVYIMCDCHEDICMADFVGWELDPNEAVADIGFEAPTVTQPPTLTPPPTLPPKGEVPSGPSNQITSAWPYRFLENGELDPRWARMMDSGQDMQNARVSIPLPKYAHFKGISGQEFFIYKNASSMDIMYKLSEGPEIMSQGYGNGTDITWVVALTGRKYVYWEDRESVKNTTLPLPDKYVDLLPSETSNSITNHKTGRDRIFEMHRGDVVTVYYDYVYVTDASGNYKTDSSGNRIIDFEKTKKCNYVCVKEAIGSEADITIPDPRTNNTWQSGTANLLFLPDIEKVDASDWGF